MNRRNLIAGIAALPLLALPSGEQASAVEVPDALWTIRLDGKQFPCGVVFHRGYYSADEINLCGREWRQQWADALNANYYPDNPIPFYE